VEHIIAKRPRDFEHGHMTRRQAIESLCAPAGFDLQISSREMKP
jgi:hypothetical protein